MEASKKIDELSRKLLHCERALFLYQKEVHNLNKACERKNKTIKRLRENQKTIVKYVYIDRVKKENK